MVENTYHLLRNGGCHSFLSGMVLLQSSDIPSRMKNIASICAAYWLLDDVVTDITVLSCIWSKLLHLSVQKIAIGLVLNWNPFFSKVRQSGGPLKYYTVFAPQSESRHLWRIIEGGSERTLFAQSIEKSWSTSVKQPLFQQSVPLKLILDISSKSVKGPLTRWMPSSSKSYAQLSYNIVL